VRESKSWPGMFFAVCGTHRTSTYYNIKPTQVQVHYIWLSLQLCFAATQRNLITKLPVKIIWPGLHCLARARHPQREKPLCVGARAQFICIQNSFIFSADASLEANFNQIISRPQSQFAPLEIKLFWRRRAAPRGSAFVLFARARVPPSRQPIIIFCSSLSHSECGQMESHTHPRIDCQPHFT
jgi:hypothetical protein